jgi:hypothetical protein
MTGQEIALENKHSGRSMPEIVKMIAVDYAHE